MRCATRHACTCCVAQTRWLQDCHVVWLCDSFLERACPPYVFGYPYVTHAVESILFSRAELTKAEDEDTFGTPLTWTTARASLSLSVTKTQVWPLRPSCLSSSSLFPQRVNFVVTTSDCVEVVEEQCARRKHQHFCASNTSSTNMKFASACTRDGYFQVLENPCVSVSCGVSCLCQCWRHAASIPPGTDSACTGHPFGFICASGVTLRLSLLCEHYQNDIPTEQKTVELNFSYFLRENGLRTLSVGKIKYFRRENGLRT